MSHEINKNQCRLCDKPARSRELCQTHFAQFARAKAKIKNEQDAEAFENEAITKGLIGPNSRKEQKVSNPFQELAKQVQTHKQENKVDDDQAEANRLELTARRSKSKTARNNNQRAGNVTPLPSNSSSPSKRKRPPS